MLCCGGHQIIVVFILCINKYNFECILHTFKIYNIMFLLYIKYGFCGLINIYNLIKYYYYY